VNNVLHNTTDVTIALSKIEVTETGRVFVVVGVRFELNEIVRNSEEKE